MKREPQEASNLMLKLSQAGSFCVPFCILLQSRRAGVPGVPHVPRAVICQEGNADRTVPPSVNLPNGGAPAYVNWARETATIRTVKFPRCLREAGPLVLPRRRRRHRGLGKNPNSWAIRAIYPPLEVRRLKYLWN